MREGRKLEKRGGEGHTRTQESWNWEVCIIERYQLIENYVCLHLLLSVFSVCHRVEIQ